MFIYFHHPKITRNATETKTLFRHQTSGDQYPDEIRKFALSLHLKSARAYRYLRSVFQVLQNVFFPLTKDFNDLECIGFFFYNSITSYSNNCRPIKYTTLDVYAELSLFENIFQPANQIFS
jgi:hypothetical protein